MSPSRKPVKIAATTTTSSATATTTAATATTTTAKGKKGKGRPSEMEREGTRGAHQHCPWSWVEKGDWLAGWERGAPSGEILPTGQGHGRCDSSEWHTRVVGRGAKTVFISYAPNQTSWWPVKADRSCQQRTAGAAQHRTCVGQPCFRVAGA